ncbi:BQ5605_C008g04914 [Microbotryum silenes-dioicae]|uniref:BQ5605_C008g04914 protein n=1 Tax=Microbotryum silenes-dioicae TaxID=796604 RepID=A0A2X0P7A3_9BASI|nr:BQ5605_C008g04914 [Microbotryum silenes-dioicae]
MPCKLVASTETGYNKVGTTCVSKTPVYDSYKCPSCPKGNGTPCNSSGKCLSGKYGCIVLHPIFVLIMVLGRGDHQCNINCNTGYKRVTGACLPNTPVFDVIKCPTPICTSAGKCDITCDTGYHNKCKSGFMNVSGQCVPDSRSLARQLPDHQERRARRHRCFHRCMRRVLRGCASFDIWGRQPVRLPLIRGGEFDGFRYSHGVVHDGVPRQCSDYHRKCPADVANKFCYNNVPKQS